MKKLLSLSIASVMFFNLTVEIFAQAYTIKGTRQGHSYFNNPKQQEQGDRLSQEIEKQRRSQDVVASLGVKYADFKREIEDYAEDNNIEINESQIKQLWNKHVNELNKYDRDYKTLVNIFSKKNYKDVMSLANQTYKKQSEEINYNDKKYDRVAFLHAAVHSVIIRDELSGKEKAEIMGQIYNIVDKEGFYPQDRRPLYSFAYQMVKNGKEYFDGDIFTKQKAEERRANGVASAIALLPVLSNNNEKAISAEAIHSLAKDIMRYDYGIMGISTAAQALLALKTDDSLKRLETLLTEDLYRGLGTRVSLYILDSVSFEEWNNRGANRGNKRNGGLGQYHNAIARRFIYIDPKKNNKDLLAKAQDNERALEVLYKAISTDTLEDIGKAIGQETNNEKVIQLADRLAARYVSDVSNKLKAREAKMHTSVIVGILATTKKRSSNLTKAAGIIYNGDWWDISEATQRDKNNIAAKYLGYSQKKYNEGKFQEFKNLCYVKKVGHFVDIALIAIGVIEIVVHAPAIIKAVKSFASRGMKAIKGDVKALGKTSQAKPAKAKNSANSSREIPGPESGNTSEYYLDRANKVEAGQSKSSGEIPGPESGNTPEYYLDRANKVESGQSKSSGEIPSPESGNTTEYYLDRANKVEAQEDTWISESSVEPQANQADIAKAEQDVKQKPTMLFKPFGFFKKLSQRILGFSEKRPYLSRKKIKMADSIADDISKELKAKGLSPENVQVETIKQTSQRIKVDTRFTEPEKIELLKRQDAKAKTLAEDYWKQSQEYFSKSETRKALDLCDKAIELNPEEAKYYRTRCSIKNLLNGGLDGLSDIGKALQLDPTNAEYWYTKGLLEWTYGDTFKMKDLALDDLQNAVLYDPHNKYYLSELEAYRREMVPIAKEARRVAKSYVESADAAIKAGDYDLALKYFEKAINEYHLDAEIYYKKALLEWEHLGQKGQAIEDITKAVDYDIGNNSYKSLLQQWRAAEVAVSGDKIYSAFPIDEVIYKLADKHTISEVKIYRVREIFDKVADDLINVGDKSDRFYLENISYDFYKQFVQQIKAEKTFTEIEKATILDVFYNERGRFVARDLFELGSSYYGKSGSLEEALKCVEKAVDLEPNNAKYIYERGKFRYEMGDLAGAKSDYARACELDPKYKKQPIIK